MPFVKIRFTCPINGATAGLIFDTTRIDSMTLSELSKSWPMHEAPKMKRFERSPDYSTWVEAFNHQFPS